ncbi:hypothetical protein KCP78_05905 [Salmonella enterica subsp. enterica]|nr:hypothetical protein KCP78_05905 [Salmonella enterica subsp. enterica]
MPRVARHLKLIQRAYAGDGAAPKCAYPRTANSLRLQIERQLMNIVQRDPTMSARQFREARRW